MPNIGLSDKVYEQIKSIKDEWDKAFINRSYDSIVNELLHIAGYKVRPDKKHSRKGV